MLIPINGVLTGAENTQIEVINPATDEYIDEIPSCTTAQVDTAVAAAAEGLAEWGALTQGRRNIILSKFIALYTADREELATLLARETGKPVSEARSEISSCTSVTRGYCEKAAHLYGNCLSVGSTLGNMDHDISFTRREPLGIIACLLPFNYPIELFGHKVMAALVAGNAAIIKPPSDNPLTIIRFVSYLHKAGVPQKAAQVITGSGSVVGSYLVSHPGIQAMSMTGSTAVGIEIYQKAAKNLTRVFLELGGNDAFIMLDDANVDLAVREALLARASNAGQICCASKRFIVHRSLCTAFAEKLVAALRGIKIGNPLDADTQMGCLINKKAALNAQKQVEHTIEQGARLLYGGHCSGGAFFEPTVLTDVTVEMDVATDLEIFAPVFPIIPFDTDEQAITIANASCYGLSGGVFSADIARAMKVAAKHQTANIVINGSGVYRTPDMAFGGYKKSGIGREGISHTLSEMTQEKTYTLKSVL